VFRPDIGGKEVRAEISASAMTRSSPAFWEHSDRGIGVQALADAIALTPKDSKLHFLADRRWSLRLDVENRLRGSGDLDRVTFTGVVGPRAGYQSFLIACDILVSPHVPLCRRQ
jgi:glycosyltransferase involved in cell wall biosynthesis